MSWRLRVRHDDPPASPIARRRVARPATRRRHRSSTCRLAAHGVPAFLVPSRNSFTPETAAYAGGRSVWWPGAADALKARVGNGSESR